ncbi:MAG: FAD-dependent oxidoreductase [Desulfobulbaceae bacterium]|nr:FAD-dependent oxidoreductase [Desulfobulbaceae bacterium]
MREDIVDVVIVGAGPAGLQAAIHAVRKKASVLLLGRLEKSSLYRAHVENYLCIEGVKEGSELLEIGLLQARRFGADYLAEDVLHIEQEEDMYLIRVESGKEIRARSLILATGTSRKKLKAKGEKRLAGKGVSYCVDCDANFFKDAKVVVVGNESAAVDGALTLLNYASEVFLVARDLAVSDELRKRLDESAVQLQERNWVKEILGENAVESVLLEDDTTLAVEGVFIELGAKGAIELAMNLGVLLDTETFTHIETDRKQAANLPGVYAAGDIAGHPYQMAKAVGEGCVAGMSAANYVRKLKKEEE